MISKFTKNSTLKDGISRYNKEDLRRLANYVGLSRYSRLNKSELLDAVAEKMLEPEVMFYRLSTFDSKELRLFEKGIGGFYEYSEDEFDTLCTFAETDYVFLGEKHFYVPADVASVWEKVNDDRFAAYTERSSWVWKCLFWTEEMYGYTPEDIFLKVINTKKGIRMEMDELMKIFYRFPQDRVWSSRTDIGYISDVFYDNDRLRQLIERQSDKEYYIPTVSEVEELYRDGALLSIPAYQDMRKFMIKDLGMSDEETNDILLDLWTKLSFEDDLHDAMQWFWNQFDFENDEQLNKIVSLYMPVANQTRMLYNRGYKPDELMRDMHFGPGHMPVITAGSSQMAQMLQEAAPVIKGMGFGLDLDSNADTIPVMGMPNGIGGEMKVAQKKVYPNDPCPCGSGKKYKKCCGKK